MIDALDDGVQRQEEDVVVELVTRAIHDAAYRSSESQLLPQDPEEDDVIDCEEELSARLHRAILGDANRRQQVEDIATAYQVASIGLAAEAALSRTSPTTTYRIWPTGEIEQRGRREAPTSSSTSRPSPRDGFLGDWNAEFVPANLAGGAEETREHLEGNYWTAQGGTATPHPRMDSGSGPRQDSEPPPLPLDMDRVRDREDLARDLIILSEMRRRMAPGVSSSQEVEVTVEMSRTEAAARDAMRIRDENFLASQGIIVGAEGTAASNKPIGSNKEHLGCGGKTENNKNDLREEDVWLNLTSDEALENIKRVFECCVCLSPPRDIPLYNCNNGHVLCLECHSSLNTDGCPSCRSPLLIRGNYLGLKPNVALSRVYMCMLQGITFSCTNVIRGCPEKKLQLSNLKEHERYCPQQQIQCPLMGYGGPSLSLPQFSANYCSNLATLDEVVNHLKNHHVNTSRIISRSYATEKSNEIGVHNWEFKMWMDVNNIMTGIRPVMCMAYEPIPEGLGLSDEEFETLSKSWSERLEEASDNPRRAPHETALAFVFARSPLFSMGVGTGAAKYLPVDSDKTANFSVWVVAAGLPEGCEPEFSLTIKATSAPNADGVTYTRYCEKTMTGKASIWSSGSRTTARKRLELISRGLEGPGMAIINSAHRLEDTDELSYSFRTMRLGERNKATEFSEFGALHAKLTIDFRKTSHPVTSNKDDEDDRDDRDEEDDSSLSSALPGKPRSRATSEEENEAEERGDCPSLESSRSLTPTENGRTPTDGRGGTIRVPIFGLTHRAE